MTNNYRWQPVMDDTPHPSHNRSRSASPSYRLSQLRRAAARYRDGKIDGDALVCTVEWFMENGA